MSWKRGSIALISVLLLALAVETTFLVIPTKEPSESANSAPPTGNANTANQVARPPCEDGLAGYDVTERIVASVPDEWEWFEDKDWGFTFAHPPGWVVTKGKKSAPGLPETLLVSYSIKIPGIRADIAADSGDAGVSLYDEPLDVALGRFGGLEDAVTHQVYDGPITLNGIPGRLWGSYNRLARDQHNGVPTPSYWSLFLQGKQWTAVVGATVAPPEMWTVLTSFKEFFPQ